MPPATARLVRKSRFALGYACGRSVCVACPKTRMHSHTYPFLRSNITHFTSIVVSKWIAFLVLHGRTPAGNPCHATRQHHTTKFHVFQEQHRAVAFTGNDCSLSSVFTSTNVISSRAIGLDKKLSKILNLIMSVSQKPQKKIWGKFNSIGWGKTLNESELV